MYRSLAAEGRAPDPRTLARREAAQLALRAPRWYKTHPRCSHDVSNFPTAAYAQFYQQGGSGAKRSELGSQAIVQQTLFKGSLKCPLRKVRKSVTCVFPQHTQTRFPFYAQSRFFPGAARSTFSTIFGLRTLLSWGLCWTSSWEASWRRLGAILGGFGEAKTAPRHPQNASRRPQDAPRRDHDGPRWPQDVPKMFPRRSQDAFKTEAEARCASEA